MQRVKKLGEVWMCVVLHVSLFAINGSMKFEKKKAKTTTYLFKTCKHRDRHRETDTFVTITALSYGKGRLSH